MPGGVPRQGGAGAARHAAALHQRGGAPAAHDAHAGLPLAQHHQERQQGGRGERLW